MFTQDTWLFRDPRTITSHACTVEGKPRVIASAYGSAIEFDGISDLVTVQTDPIAGWATWTVEVIFRPDAGGGAEQRFLHLQESANENRVLLETRVADDKSWYADTYIRSGATDQPLNDPELLHPLGEWHSMALTFDGTSMRQYVNARLELVSPVSCTPHGAGRTAVGMRINRVYPFKGAIAVARFSSIALASDALLRP